MGHLLLRRAPEEKPDFKGVCPYHGDCLEGLASGPAIEARWGKPATELPPDHPAWTLEADYLAQACFQMACILSPQAIVLGGGVMDQRQLFPLIRASEIAGNCPAGACLPGPRRRPGSCPGRRLRPLTLYCA
jgi:fructokinase